MYAVNRWGVPNQIVIYADEGTYFQSYDSIIVFKDNEGNVFLGKDWDYSRTTAKYRNKFLNENAQETQRKLDEGIYKLNYNL